MNQLDLFNGEELRDIGIAQVTANNPGHVTSICRMILAVEHGKIFTADDLDREVLAAFHPNAIGAAFRYCAERGWILSAGTAKARRGPAHARKLTKWRRA